MQSAKTAKRHKTSVWKAGHSKCWFGNKHYVFVAYRHDLAENELIFTHRNLKKKVL